MKKFSISALIAASLIFASCGVSPKSNNRAGSADISSYNQVSVAYKSSSGSAASSLIFKTKEEADESSTPVLVGIDEDGEIEELNFVPEEVSNEEQEAEDVSMDNVKVFTRLTGDYSFVANSKSQEPADCDTHSTSLYTSGLNAESDFIMDMKSGDLYSLKSAFKAVADEVFELNGIENCEDCVSKVDYYNDFDGLIRNQMLTIGDDIYLFAYLNLNNPNKGNNINKSEVLCVYKMDLSSGEVVFNKHKEIRSEDNQHKNILFANKTIYNSKIYYDIDGDNNNGFLYDIKADKTEQSNYGSVTLKVSDSDKTEYIFQNQFSDNTNRESNKALDFEPLAIDADGNRYFAGYYMKDDGTYNEEATKTVWVHNPNNVADKCYVFYGGNFVSAPNEIIQLDKDDNITIPKKFGNIFRLQGCVASSIIYGIEVEGELDVFKEDGTRRTYEECAANIKDDDDETLIVYYPAANAGAKEVRYDLKEVFEGVLNYSDYTRRYVTSRVSEVRNIKGLCVLRMAKPNDIKDYKFSLSGKVSAYDDAKDSKYELIDLQPVVK